MKKITFLKKGMPGKIAFAILMLISSLGWTQPTVTVPSTVQVVVAGSGGTTGFGGTVGSGGVVVMPDPGSGSFLINPNGNTLGSWSLLGDLSFQSSSLSQSLTASTTPQSIYSYNKVVRSSELADPSGGTLARSKGRVTISYAAGTCGGSISFEIFKQYNNASYLPQIIGPGCLLPNTVYTYSVDQIASDNADDAIGFDKYYWAGLPAGSTNVYYSADRSSITFRTGSTVTAPVNLRCNFGRANPWDGDIIPLASHTTFVIKTIGAVPSEPLYTQAPPSCLPTTASSGSFSITVDPASLSSNNTYTWSQEGTSWSLSPTGTLGANLNVSNVDNNPGKLILTVDNGSCDPSIFTYEINRNFTSAISITPANSCVSAGTATVFSLPANAQINTTTWTLPTGWSILPTGSNTPLSIANISIPSSTAAGSYTLIAKSTACPSTSISVTVNVRPATPSFVISGSISPNCVVRNGGPAVTYTVNAVAGATSYQWTFPTGWTPSSQTTTTPTISVTPGGTTTSGTVTVTAIGANGCNSSTVTRTINYSGITPNAISASCWSIGVTGQTIITVANAPSPFYGTYTVSSSPTGLFSSYSVNTSTGAITLNTNATATPGTYNLTITHSTGGSCAAATATLPVTVSGNTAVFNNPTITGGSFDPSPGGCDTYTIINATAGSTYQWFLNGSSSPVVANGTTVFFSPSGNALTLCGSGSAPTSVCVIVTNGTCKTKLCAPLVGTHSAARQANPKSQQSEAEKISIYPNPNVGNFNIYIKDFEKSASATISDNTGKFISKYNLEKGENKIQNENLAKGAYTITLEIDGKKESRQIIIK